MLFVQASSDRRNMSFKQNDFTSLEVDNEVDKIEEELFKIT